MAESPACGQLPFTKDSPAQLPAPCYLSPPIVGVRRLEPSCSAARKHVTVTAVQQGLLGEGGTQAIFWLTAHSSAAW